MMKTFTTPAVCLASVLLPLAAHVAGCGGDETETTTASTMSSASTFNEPTNSVGSGGTGGGGGAGGGGGGAGGGGGSASADRHLDPALFWGGDNRAKLDALLDNHGDHLASYDPNKKPVAIFDWDNTVIKNDIGDIVTFWMLNNDKILQPPGKNWKLTSPFLTPEAVTALDAACNLVADAGQPLPTSQVTGTVCADEIVSVYYTGMTKSGSAAFSGWNYRTLEPAYAWTVQLQAGYTPAEIKGFAEEAMDAALKANVGDAQTVGTTMNLNAYLRIYDQIKDLIGAMQDDGFDVWVLSASSQHIVEPFAAMVGVGADHVIGVRAVVDKDGLLTYNFQGCGSVVEGTNDGMGAVTGNTMITYLEGKRCWMNKVIYGDTTATAEQVQQDLSKRPVFGAGDSDTDVSFLQDATGLKLAINRNKNEIMCNAYANAGGTWLINPMFMAPRGELAAGYACSTTACKDKFGMKVACVDESGKVIPDQKDTVFCAGGMYDEASCQP